MATLPVVVHQRQSWKGADHVITDFVGRRQARPVLLVSYFSPDVLSPLAQSFQRRTHARLRRLDVFWKTS